jgi:hypothetical protein
VRARVRAHTHTRTVCLRHVRCRVRGVLEAGKEHDEYEELVAQLRFRVRELEGELALEKRERQRENDEWRATVHARDEQIAELRGEVSVLERRVAELEATLVAQGEEKRLCLEALSKVYHNAERGQRARGPSGCLACAQNEGLARRCLSPGIEGPPSDLMQAFDDVHPIDVGELGSVFCTTCRGLEGASRHAPAWRAVLEPFTCAALGAPQRAGSPPHYVFRPIPIPSAGPSSRSSPRACRAAWRRDCAAQGG